MTQFFREYPDYAAIGQPPVAQLAERPVPRKKGQVLVAQLPMATAAALIGQPAVAQLPWAHNVILIQKVKDLPTRFWYAQQAFEHG